MILYDSQRSGVSIQSPRSPWPHVQDAKAPDAHRMPAGEVRQAVLPAIHKRCDDPSEDVAAPSAIRRSDSKLIAPSQTRTRQDFRKPTISAIEAVDDHREEDGEGEGGDGGAEISGLSF